jgi:hypothetical protein
MDLDEVVLAAHRSRHLHLSQATRTMTHNRNTAAATAMPHHVGSLAAWGGVTVSLPPCLVSRHNGFTAVEGSEWGWRR